MSRRSSSLGVCAKRLAAAGRGMTLTRSSYRECMRKVTNEHLVRQESEQEVLS